MAESTNDSDGRLSARELTLSAKETIEDLTGYPPESVSGLQWDGGELQERHREVGARLELSGPLPAYNFVPRGRA
jgi:hypothetical protein